MSDTQLLIGSLSNDLFRIAALVQRGSDEAAVEFLLQAKRWAKPLQSAVTAKYITDIAKDVNTEKIEPITLARAERYLMYGVLLQNYALHNQ